MGDPLILPSGAIGAADHFVGRKAELALLADMGAIAAARGRPQLALVQAPPGAGKTALLREAARHAAESGAVVIEVPAGSLGDAERLRAEVVAQLSLRDRWRELLPTLRFGLPAGVDGSVAVGPEQTDAAGGLLRGLRSLSARCGTAPHGPSAVLLLVDEAQTLADHDRPTVQFLLNALRSEPGLRTATVLAGLPDTRDAVRSPSLARAHHALELGALRREESVELLGLWLADNRFRATGPEPLDEIASHAQDWPEHLVHHVTAMLEAARENGGVVDRKAAECARRATAPAMRRYYAARLHGLAAGPPEDQDALAALALVDRVCGSLSVRAAGRLLRDAGAGPDLLRRLRHAGVLVEDDRRRYRFAIPSLRTYVLDTADPLPGGLTAAVEAIAADAGAAGERRFGGSDEPTAE